MGEVHTARRASDPGPVKVLAVANAIISGAGMVTLTGHTGACLLE